MKSLFFAILRTTLVIAVGMAASAAIALWLFSGKAPFSIKSFQEATKDLASFHQLKKQMVGRSFIDAENIKDDSQEPPGINAEISAASEADAALLAQLDAEIAEAKQDAARERELLQQRDIVTMKSKLERLQKQLDRVENQNRSITLKLTKLLKDTKVTKE